MLFRSATQTTTPTTAKTTTPTTAQTTTPTTAQTATPTTAAARSPKQAHSRPKISGSIQSFVSTAQCFVSIEHTQQVACLSRATRSCKPQVCPQQHHSPFASQRAEAHPKQHLAWRQPWTPPLWRELRPIQAFGFHSRGKCISAPTMLKAYPSTRVLSP